MSRVLIPSLTISSNIEVRKQRLLPIAGRVLVSVGQNVTPQTIVAESERPGELHIIRASDSLNLTPSETLKYVVVKEGMTVRQGDILAEVSSMWGLFSSKVVAPVDGVVEFITSAARVKTILLIEMILILIIHFSLFCSCFFSSSSGLRRTSGDTNFSSSSPMISVGIFYRRES